MNEPELSNDSGASPTNATAFAAMPGSPARVAAVEGYMKDRHVLCTALSEISSTYDREDKRHARIVEEIKRIDAAVGGLLAQESDAGERLPAENQKP